MDLAGLTPKYEHPHAPSGRKSFLPTKPAPVPSTGGSSRIPSRSRVPSTSAKPSLIPVEPRQSLEAGTGVRSPSRPVDEAPRIYSHSKSSQPDYPQRRGNSYHTENIGLSRTRTESGATPGAGDSSGSQRLYSAADSKQPNTPNEKDVVHISSVKDMPLPVPPLPRAGLVPKDRGARDGWNTEEARPKAISSPLETILMGSNPNAAPSARRMSTPIRTEQESPMYVHAAPTVPTTPSSRRFSAPSPGNGNGSSRTPVNDQTPKEQEAPPTILQRLVRRASFSTGKSPKQSNGTPKSPRSAGTPKNRAAVEQYHAESPFGLDIVTPRAIVDPGMGSSTLGFDLPGVAPQDLPQSQKHRQSGLRQPVVPLTAGTKKPRPKVVDAVAGAQGDVEKLGSPFMGDGSPRFGIDERFRSPRARSKSGLRNDILGELRDESQELFDYYTGDDTASNTEDYLAEETPIATVLSSPGDARRGTAIKPPAPSSPMVQSRRQSQHRYGGRVCVEPVEATNAEDHLRGKTLRDNSSLRTLRDRTPSRVTFSPKAPDATRENTQSFSESSRMSQFSDSPDERETIAKPPSHLTIRGERGGVSRQGEAPRELASPALSKSRHDKRDLGQTAMGDAYTKPSSAQPGLARTRINEPPQGEKGGSGRAANHGSQLPVPKARKTNSALFRALEQPYENLPFSSNAPTDMSSDSLRVGSQDTEYDPTNDSVGQLHTVSSNLSSLNGDGVGDIRWSGAYELSSATDVLFQNINESDVGIGQPRVVIEEPSDAYVSDVVDDDSRDIAYLDGVEYEQDIHNQLGALREPAEQNQGMVSRDKNRRVSMSDKRKAVHGSWRASLEDDQLGQPKSILDPVELERQHAIWEFHESEEAYVDTLQTVLRFFVQPLRTQHQRQWISGLAPGVMRLFDWLDDITNLHEQLLGALDALRQSNQSALIDFSDTIRPFVPLMELYQPYVIRVEQISKQIVTMALDPESDFGEFVRMQSALPECNQVNLGDILAKPTQRLQDYVGIFQRVLTHTPRTHPDYLATFSLLHSMHAIVCVIQEVKSQEEEYNVIKSLLSRVRGLPPGFMIATRERRLLAQGFLQQIHLPRNPAFPQQLGTGRRPGSPGTTGRARSGSQSTTVSSTTDSTESSVRPISSSAARLKDSSTEYSMRSDSSATSYMNTSRDGRKTNRVSFLPHIGATPPPRASRSRSRTATKLEQLPETETTDTYVLVFEDFVFLAKPGTQVPYQHRSPRGAGAREEWSMLDAIGAFRVLGVGDLSGQYGYESVISLDLVSIDNNPKSTSNVSNSPMTFSIPNPGKGVQRAHLEPSRVRQEWFESFNRCYLHTLRSVLFSSGSGALAALNHFSETSQQSSTSSIMDILANGLGFPKSPSQQLKRETRLKQHGLPPVENTEEEREERRFWAERFKTVSGEMRRTYEGLPLPQAAEDRIYNQSASQRNMTKTCRSSGTMI
ncbi:hypothetical protein FRC10_010795 [Ceratobasidium sp. 414]|nr:hypothetical protein FRC10_010795 [Ceratobasidium sp. 414]